MKNFLIILLVLTSLASCKNNAKNTSETENNTPQKQEINTVPVAKTEISNSNVLCKINGEEWAYTKAFGIIDRNARTKKRTTIITFKKKLKKGSESIQLTYDGDTNKLITTSLQLKFEDKEGKLQTYFYLINPDNKDRRPETTMQGTIDLSNPNTASGTAETLNLSTMSKRQVPANPKDGIINLTDLKFEGVGYSDLDKVFNALK